MSLCVMCVLCDVCASYVMCVFVTACVHELDDCVFMVGISW